MLAAAEFSGVTMARRASLPGDISPQEAETRSRSGLLTSLNLEARKFSENLGQGQPEGAGGTPGSDSFQLHVPGPRCLADRMKEEDELEEGGA